jgi:hypothetical protein
MGCGGRGFGNREDGNVDGDPLNESDVQFVDGGPAHRLMRRLGIMRRDSLSVGRRALFFAAITWVPLLVFSAIDGRATGPTPGTAFLYDFTTYARFLVALPLLFAAEALVGGRFRAATLQFVHAGMVRPEDVPAMDAAVRRSRRMIEARLPEVLMLAIALFGAWFLTVEAWRGGATAAWNSFRMESGRLSLAGLWHHFVAIPIFQFFLAWWLWRLVAWAFYLYAMSRLRLNLVAAHADRAGGLGFIGLAHTSLGLLALAVSSVMSADIANQVRYAGAPIHTFEIFALTYLVIAGIVCYGPLVLFTPMLLRARKEGLVRYGIFVATYNRLFRAKWIDAAAPPLESLLGSEDIQALSAVGTSFEVIEQTRPLPFTLRQVLQFTALACIPGVPLILLVVPVTRVLKFIANALL